MFIAYKIKSNGFAFLVESLQALAEWLRQQGSKVAWPAWQQAPADR
jgi:hypothetical protein